MQKKKGDHVVAFLMSYKSSIGSTIVGFFQKKKTMLQK